MDDNTSPQLKNTDREAVPEAGSSDSRIYQRWNVTNFAEYFITSEKYCY